MHRRAFAPSNAGSWPSLRLLRLCAVTLPAPAELVAMSDRERQIAERVNATGDLLALALRRDVSRVPGAHYASKGEHTNKVLLTVLRAAGVTVPEFGSGEVRQTMACSAFEV